MNVVELSSSEPEIVEETPNYKKEIQLDTLVTIPDVKGLFNKYNELFFNGELKPKRVYWSQRMTRCAGLCRIKNKKPFVFEIALSIKLLQFRPTIDLIETLIHEMIHAHIISMEKRNIPHDSHGFKFVEEMQRINKLTGLNISIFHNFQNEVRYYRIHVWRCNVFFVKG